MIRQDQVKHYFNNVLYFPKEIADQYDNNEKNSFLLFLHRQYNQAFMMSNYDSCQLLNTSQYISKRQFDHHGFLENLSV